MVYIPKKKTEIVEDFHEIYQNKDFVKFLSYLKVPKQAKPSLNRKKRNKETSGFITLEWDNLFDEQKRFIEDRTGFDIILKPRQSGFTTIVNAYDLFIALSTGGARVLAVCDKKKLQDEMMRQIKSYYHQLEDLGNRIRFPLVPKFEDWNKDQITFPEIDSTITITPAMENPDRAEKIGRGSALYLIHSTETAFQHNTNLIMGNCMAANPTEVIIESTPKGPRGYFYETVKEAMKGENDFSFHFYAWPDHKNYSLETDEYINMNPRDSVEEKLVSEFAVTEGQMRWWRSKVKNLGFEKAAREYPIDPISCFRGAEKTFIRNEDFEWVASQGSPPVQTIPIGAGMLFVWHAPDVGKKYILGADCGNGLGKDASALYVIDHESGGLCAALYADDIAPYDFAKICEEVAERYNYALIAAESNNNAGGICISRLQRELRYPNLYYRRKPDGKGVYSDAGFQTLVNTRDAIFSILRGQIEAKTASLLCPRLVSELTSLVITDRGKIEAAPGAHDDTVMAYGIACCVRKERQPKSDRLGGYRSLGQRDFSKYSPIY